MSLLRFLPFRAALEWHFVDPDTDHQYQAATKLELLQKILKYREQNELEEIEMLGAVVDNYLCHQPQNVGKCGRNPDIKRSIWQFMKGGIVLVKNVEVPNPVSWEVANKRAEVCIGCPHNVNPDKKGLWVKWADRLAESALGGKRCKYHQSLFNCEVCTCPLRVKVFVPGPFELDAEEKEKMGKVNCWQILE